MTDLWRSLQIGDRVRLVQMPPELVKTGASMDEETRNLYEQLVEERRVMEVEEIDETGCPWVSVTHVDDGRVVWRSVPINHGGLERVSSPPPRGSKS